jgi:serine/threonine protein kinase
VPTTPGPASDAPSLAAQLPERIGPFSITGVLGRGGMGVVFDAVARDGRRVALKVIRPYGDPERAELLIARFLREAQILEQLDHPGVVKLVASGETEGVLYLAMERIEGVSLLTIRRQGSLAFEALCVLGAQLCDALAHMHDAGVVHRDIKPANILIDQTGQPIITDFGISGLDEATGITRQGDLLGSPGFMAPEVIEGKTPTPRSDQFSLGRLLYELGALGGAKKLPRGAPILEVLQAALEIDWNRFPQGDDWDRLRPILQRMLATDPADRYTTSRDALAALRSLSGSDALDSDTLSEHVTKLPVSTSWEALAHDLEISASERPPEPKSAETLTPGYSGGEDELTQLDLDLAHDVMKPRDIAKILEPTDPPALDPDLTHALRQISTLQKELDRIRTRRPPSPSVAPWIALAFFALIAGAAGGWFVRTGQPPPPPLVIVPSHGRPFVEPKYTFDEKRGIPSAKDQMEAREMLRAAEDHLAKKDLGAAERLLQLCIDMADLPECHKLLGSILALQGDARARGHFMRYVELAPDAPEAGPIRKLLDN